MDILASFFGQIYNLFQIEMMVFGFTFSFWDVFMFSLIVSVIFGFLGGVLHED